MCQGASGAHFYYHRYFYGERDNREPGRAAHLEAPRA